MDAMHTTAPATLAPRYQQMLDRPAISPKALADLWEVSEFIIYKMCRSGELESFRIGRSIRIPTAAVRRRMGIAA